MHETLWIWMYYTSSRMISQSFRIPCFIHLILLERKTCLYVGNPSFISFSPYTSLFLITFRFPFTSGTELWLNNSLSSWELDCMRQPTLILFCAADMVHHSTCVKSVCQENKHEMWGYDYFTKKLRRFVCLPYLLTGKSINKACDYHAAGLG